MHQVAGEYPDYQNSRLKSSFYLNANQTFNPYSWSPPIHWEGFVGGRPVKFTQTSSSASGKECFDWSGFPEDLAIAIHYIVEAIDKAMRVMD